MKNPVDVNCVFRWHGIEEDPPIYNSKPKPALRRAETDNVTVRR
jgi:hypothetical protein